VETDLGAWRTYETPGHAPSHVVFHQPERRLLMSGDLIVGRVFLYFDHGHTPDPVGEFLSSLDVVEGLDTGLCVSGHGRPFRNIPPRAQAYRDEVARQLDGVRRTLEEGPKSPFEIVLEWLGRDDPPPAAVGYGLELTLSYLDHLAILGEARRAEGAEPDRWERVPAPQSG
jgi:glyoxylase-like metal-dependent hydrolase (beta-lactamase superfamily II)